MSDDTGVSAGPPQPRRSPRLVVAVVVALVLVAGGAAWFLTHRGHDVDEVAWRADVERQLRHPIGDWASYRNLWLEECEKDDDELELFVGDGHRRWVDRRDPHQPAARMP